MDFVNEENIAILEVGENGGEVAGAFNGGTGGDAEIGAHFAGDDAGHGGFTEAGRSVEKDVIKDGAIGTLFDGIYSEFEVGFEVFLPDIIGKTSRPERSFFGLLGGVII